MRMSSKYTTTTPSEIRSSNIASIIVWKVAGLLVRPKNMTRGFIKALVSLESGFLFISFFHVDIIETPTNIEFGEILCPLQFIYKFRNEG